MSLNGKEARREKGRDVRRTLWRTAAAWVFLLAMLVGKGIALGYSGIVIAEGIAIGLVALAVIMILIKYLDNE